MLTPFGSSDGTVLFFTNAILLLVLVATSDWQAKVSHTELTLEKEGRHEWYLRAIQFNLIHTNRDHML